MSIKKQLLSPKARALIEDYRVDVMNTTMTSERGTRAELKAAEDCEALSKYALESYVLSLERARRRLKDELGRVTSAYKLLLDRKD